MNSKWHLYTSIVKSLLRIGGCVVAAATMNWVYIAIFFFLAEWLGIVEELGDER